MQGAQWPQAMNNRGISRRIAAHDRRDEVGAQSVHVAPFSHIIMRFMRHGPWPLADFFSILPGTCPVELPSQKQCKEMILRLTRETSPAPFFFDTFCPR